MPWQVACISLYKEGFAGPRDQQTDVFFVCKQLSCIIVLGFPPSCDPRMHHPKRMCTASIQAFQAAFALLAVRQCRTVDKGQYSRTSRVQTLHQHLAAVGQSGVTGMPSQATR